MDPQNPGQPQPPQWGQPQPPQWGQPQPPDFSQQVPGMPGMPAWTPPPKKSNRGKIIAIVAVVAVVVIGVLVAVSMLLGGDGKVTFSTAAYDQNSSSCHFDNPITAAKTTDNIYILAYFKDTMQSGDSFSLTIYQDGVNVNTQTTVADTKFNCYFEKAAVKLPAGTFKLVFKYNDKIEAEGSLTVTE
jgi:hypothetical protein